MPKDATIKLRAESREVEKWKAQAAEKGLGLSEWIRGVLNDQSASKPAVEKRGAK
jgi:predicted DNA binding CopG/RHH family protein